MNSSLIQPMLAHGEAAILPALLLIVVLYPISIWILVRSLKGGRSRLMVVCATVIALCSGLASAAVLKDFEWPPDQGFYFALLFWAFPLFCGIAALARMKRPNKNEQHTSS